MGKMTEKQLQDAVIDLAKWNGWRYYHTYDSRKSVVGFPDLVLVRGERLIFAEVKSDGGKATQEQLNWLGDLHKTAAEVYLWWPKDFTMGRIEKVLGRWYTEVT